MTGEPQAADLFARQIQEARVPATHWWSFHGHKSPEWTTWWDEQLSWKHAVALWSQMAMPFVRVCGPDAARFLSDHFVNSFASPVRGQVKQVVACREDGKIIMETMCQVRGAGEFDLSVVPGYVSLLQFWNRDGAYDIDISPVPLRGLTQVSGPKSVELLQRLTPENISDIKFGRFTPEPVKLAGYDVQLVRLTMSGELGFELETPLEQIDAIADAIVDAGQDLGIQRLGARNHLQQHLEAAIPGFYGDGLPALIGDPGDPPGPFMEYVMSTGLPFPEYFAPFLARWPVFPGAGLPKISGSFEPRSWSDFFFSPVEAGLGGRINLNHDFPGKAVLAQELARPRRRKVALEWDKAGVVEVYASMFSEGEPHVEVDGPHFDYMEMPRDPRLGIEASTVLAGGRPAGFTAARTYSYSYRRMLSNCVIPVEYAEPGTQVEIVWGDPGHPQKLIRATVATLPYKPDRTRTLPADRKVTA